MEIQTDTMLALVRLNAQLRLGPDDATIEIPPAVMPTCSLPNLITRVFPIGVSPYALGPAKSSFMKADRILKSGVIGASNLQIASLAKGYWELDWTCGTRHSGGPNAGENGLGLLDPAGNFVMLANHRMSAAADSRNQNGSLAFATDADGWHFDILHSGNGGAGDEFWCAAFLNLRRIF